MIAYLSSIRLRRQVRVGLVDSLSSRESDEPDFECNRNVSFFGQIISLYRHCFSMSSPSPDTIGTGMTCWRSRSLFRNRAPACGRRLSSSGFGRTAMMSPCAISREQQTGRWRQKPPLPLNSACFDGAAPTLPPRCMRSRSRSRQPARRAQTGPCRQRCPIRCSNRWPSVRRIRIRSLGGNRGRGRKVACDRSRPRQEDAGGLGTADGGQAGIGGTRHGGRACTRHHLARLGGRAFAEGRPLQ